MLITRPKCSLFIVADWTAYSWHLQWHVDNIIIYLCILLVLVAQRIQRAALLCLLDLGPRPLCLRRRCLPSHPHILMDTFSRHSAYCKVSISWFRTCLVSNVLKTWSPCLQQVNSVGQCSNYKTKPSTHIHLTDIAHVCGPTHSSHVTFFFPILDFATTFPQTHF